MKDITIEIKYFSTMEIPEIKANLGILIHYNLQPLLGEVFFASKAGELQSY